MGRTRLTVAGVTAGAVALALATTGQAHAGVPGALASFDHLVVIYEENHSFDNLYGSWAPIAGQPVEGLAQASDPEQVDQHGNPLGCLLQLDANLVPSSATVTWLDGSQHHGLTSQTCTGTGPTGIAFASHFGQSTPFRISQYIKPADRTCAPETMQAVNGVQKGDPKGLPGGCTRDLVHRFYQEQYQLDDGLMDRYATGSDAAGLTMGHYDTAALPIYQYLHAPNHPPYVLADHFFQGAFGGSFLNHQYLIAARAPQYDPGSAPNPPTGLNSALDVNGFPTDKYPLYAPVPMSRYNDGVLTAACLLGRPGVNGLPVDITDRACGDYAVNTMQPPWQPAGGGTVLPPINDSDPTKPIYETNIGDELSRANVSWAWYAGGWDNAAGNVRGRGWTNGHDDKTCLDDEHAPKAVYPYCADALFQFHHQPFNYFSNYAPGKPGRAHLKDEEDFSEALRTGTLPAVSFLKPDGEENEHPGYASTENGESHLIDLLTKIQRSPQAARTLVVVSYDEFGGTWDHVAPPGQGNHDGPADAYGPGTRIPTLLIGGPLGKSAVDHTSYDTTSVLATIERRWHLAPLGTRDAAVHDLGTAMLAGGSRHR
jgi:phospholipase C